MTDKASTKVSIRRATRSDLPALTRLCAAHAAYERAPFDPDGHSDRLAAAIDAPTPRLVLFLAEIDGKEVGYTALTRDFSTWAARDFFHMDCLFVDESHRGSGIGRQLFDAVLREARKAGIGELQWQTPAWNADALRFYRRLGANDVEKARFVFPVAQKPETEPQA